VSLETEITRLAAAGQSADRAAARELFARLREALSSGTVRAAEPDAASPIGWRVNLCTFEMSAIGGAVTEFHSVRIARQARVYNRYVRQG